MKVLVTGANGYLGQGIVKTILDQGHVVIAADRSDQFIDERAIHKVCNLFAVEDPYSFFEEPEVLLHLAWRDGFVHYSDAHIDDLGKHFHFLEKMFASSIDHIAVMGSVHEIGFLEGSVKEDTTCRPESFYGIAKNALRDMVKILSKQQNKPYQWLRGYYIVGHAEAGCSVFSKLYQAAKRGEKTFPFTMGLNQFDFLDYPEFCEQVAAAVTQQEVNGTINICSGRPEKLSDRMERFIRENELDIKLEYGTFPDRPYDSKAIWGDDEKIRSIMAGKKE